MENDNPVSNNVEQSGLGINQVSNKKVEQKTNNTSTVIILVILLVVALGGFYFYNKSKTPVIPEVPVVTDTNTTVPADTTQNNNQQKSIDTSDWKTTKVMGYGSYDHKLSIIYPPDWKVVFPENNDECDKSIMCMAGMAQAGKLATRLIPPDLSPDQYDYSSKIIYIGANSEAGDNICDTSSGSFQSFCYEMRSTEAGVVLWTNSDADVATINIAKAIAEDYKKKNSISTTLPQYIGGQSGWPPVVSESSFAYKCIPSHSQNSDTVEKNIGSRTYCITNDHEGAAGSTYNTYTYKTFGIQGSSKSTTFTLRYSGCGGYDDPQMTQCKTAQSNFNANLDTLIDSLMQ